MGGAGKSPGDEVAPTSIAMKGGDRPTRLLPYAKMLLVPKSLFSLLWVDYAPEGSG